MNMGRSASDTNVKTLKNKVAPMNGNGNGRKLGPSTWIPLGSVIALFVLLLGAYQWLDAQFDIARGERIELKHSLEVIKSATDDRWRGSDMKLWCEMLRQRSPEMADKVPNPWEILDRRKGK
jgi:hypothetical protein